jgi:hypothetical protein
MSTPETFEEFAQAAEATPPEGATDRKRKPVHQKRDALAPSATAVHEEHADIQWTPPQSLDAPPPRPGMTQRWIRAQNGPQQDIKNWSRKMREGWVPRDPTSLPKEWQGLPTAKMTHGNGTVANAIMVEGMVLCEMPMARKRQRDAFFQAKSAALMSAVNSELDAVQRQGGIPINRTARTQVKTGPHAAMADRDEGVGDV